MVPNLSQGYIKVIQKVVSKLVQSCLKVVLSQSYVKVVQKLYQISRKIVSKLSQVDPNVVYVIQYVLRNITYHFYQLPYILISALMQFSALANTSRQEICHNSYITRFSGQKFYTLKLHKLQLLLFTMEQRK